MAAQFLTTSRLGNIINMIGLGRQSGILRVVRGQGPTRELGQIKFLDGEPVSALLGQLTGPNALSVLGNWGECIYSFDEQYVPDLPENETSMDMLRRLAADPGHYSPPNSSPASGSWPAYNWPSSMPSPAPNTSTNLGGSYPGLGTYPGADTTGYGGGSGGYGTAGYGTGGYGTGGYATGGYGGNGYGSNSNRYGGGSSTQQNPGGYGGGGQFQQSYPQQYPSQYPQQGRTNAAPAQVTDPLNPELLAARPARTMLSEHVEQLPLDRRERMVLLLVDGRRTLSDLARLTRRTEREVLAVLDHMATLGLVSFES